MLRTIAFTIAAMAASLAAGAAMASSTGRCGGTGGDHSKTLACPAGQNIVAMSARKGVVTDQIGIKCGKVNANGTTSSIGSWKTAGPGGGTDQKFAQCAAGHAISALWIVSGIYLDTIDHVACSDRGASGEFEQATGFPRLSDTTIPAMPCDIECPPGEALYELRIKYGSVVDSITGACRK